MNNLANWSQAEGQGLARVVLTDNFRTGFAFAAQVAQLAERADYYPEMILAQNRVTIQLSKVDADKANGLAKAIDKLIK